MSEYTEEDISRFESYLKLFIKSDAVDLEGKLQALNKRDRRLYYFLIANIIAAVFFVYSYIRGLSTLNGYMYIVIFGIFILNVFLLLYQRKQIKRLKKYLKETNS